MFFSALRYALLTIALVFVISSNNARANDKLTLLLDWFVNPDHAPLYVAKQKGYFENQGIELQMIAPADPNDPPKLVAAGKADIAISYQPQLHVHVSKGLPLKRFGTLVATPLNTLLVLADGPINSISDLKDRKVGYSVGGFEDALLKAMLAPHNLTLKDITLINVNFSLSPALLSGQVDAVIGAYRNFELNQLKIEGETGKAFFVEEEGVPAYDELILIAHSENMDTEILRRFLNALDQGVQYLVNHPQESWSLFIKEHPQLNDKLNRLAWHDTLPRFALRPAALDTGRYLRFSKFMQQQGLIKDIPQVSDYAVELQ